MSIHPTDGEIVGTNVLTAVVIVGSFLLLLASITSPAPVPARSAVAQTAPIEEVVVTAPLAGRAS